MIKTERSGKNSFSGRKVQLVNYLPHIGTAKIQEEIVRGLKSDPKYIASKFFYDEMGSQLFSAISQLDEYYPTDTEKSILATIVKKMDIDFSGLDIIELGSGDAEKISLILRQISKEQLSTMTYYPLDISASAIEKASEMLAYEFPMLRINGIVADFIHQIHLTPRTGKRFFCFLGSTIGNLSKNEIKEFIGILGGEMQTGESFLLGMDMVKDSSVLEKAYNDDKEVTAAFNKNILNVVNRYVGTDFNPEDFEHLAFYDKKEKRIEMHLRARRDVVSVLSPTNEKVHIQKGETIHTENSHKFSKEDIEKISLWGKLNIEGIYTDDKQWFSLVHLKKIG